MAPKETSPSGYGTIPSSSTAPSAPPPPSPTNVQVIAPATLQAGYTFDAMYDGVTFTVTVPEGGVVKGQRFIVPFVPPAGQDAPPTATAVGEPLSSANTGSGGGGGGSTIPTGVWRDSLCDCLRFGPCHPHFLNAWFCRLVLLGQILTRMKMTWLGFRTRGNPDDRRWKSTFSIMVKLTIAYYVLDILTSPADPETGDDDVNVTLNSVIGAVMFFYTTYVLIQLRATLRHVYSIPEESCLCLYEMGLCGNNPREGICGSGGGGGDDDGSSSTRLCTSGVAVGWEDVCCAFWCPLCVAGQMARHTVDYEQRGRRAVCCNEVGVENWEEDDAYEGVVRVGEGSVLVV